MLFVNKDLAPDAVTMTVGLWSMDAPLSSELHVNCLEPGLGSTWPMGQAISMNYPSKSVRFALNKHVLSGTSHLHLFGYIPSAQKWSALFPPVLAKLEPQTWKPLV